MLETKHLSTRAVLKTSEDDAGEIEAIFSSFGVVDRDGDIVEAGAIPNGQNVPMVWSHNWERIIGRGTTETDEKQAVFKGRLFLETEAGLDAYKTIKAMDDLQEYSWGFRILDADFVERDEEFIRVIKRAELYEVSPVLVGAGHGTQTLALKHGMPYLDHAESLLEAVEDFTRRTRDRKTYRAVEGRPLTANRERLVEIADALSGAASDISTLLKESEPLDIDLDALFAEYMTVTARQNGVQV